MRIALMGYIPYDVVFGHIEYVMEGDGEFDNAETGGEVSTCFRDGFDEFPSEFVG
jgi:hypothetical protein